MTITKIAEEILTAATLQSGKYKVVKPCWITDMGATEGDILEYQAGAPSKMRWIKSQSAGYEEMGWTRSVKDEILESLLKSGKIKKLK